MQSHFISRLSLPLSLSLSLSLFPGVIVRVRIMPASGATQREEESSLSRPLRRFLRRFRFVAARVSPPAFDSH